jgi:2-dehydro-3-deoxy-D-arabinonate dehydratase
MKRNFPELADYLCKEMVFEHGCFLMTGTGIVPGNDFTLQSGDEVSIGIENIGLLTNIVAYRM